MNNYGALKSLPAQATIKGQPHQLSYITPQEAGVLKMLGGSGENFNGVPAYVRTDDYVPSNMNPNIAAGYQQAADSGYKGAGSSGYNNNNDNKKPKVETPKSYFDFNKTENENYEMALALDFKWAKDMDNEFQKETNPNYIDPDAFTAPMLPETGEAGEAFDAGSYLGSDDVKLASSTDASSGGAQLASSTEVIPKTFTGVDDSYFNEGQNVGYTPAVAPAPTSFDNNFTGTEEELMNRGEYTGEIQTLGDGLFEVYVDSYSDPKEDNFDLFGGDQNFTIFGIPIPFSDTIYDLVTGGGDNDDRYYGGADSINTDDGVDLNGGGGGNDDPKFKYTDIFKPKYKSSAMISGGGGGGIWDRFRNSYFTKYGLEGESADYEEIEVTFDPESGVYFYPDGTPINPEELEGLNIGDIIQKEDGKTKTGRQKFNSKTGELIETKLYDQTYSTPEGEEITGNQTFAADGIGSDGSYTSDPRIYDPATGTMVSSTQYNLNLSRQAEADYLASLNQGD